MQSIQIQGVTDADGDPVIITPTSIKADEAVNGCGDGDTSPDGLLSPLQVRAERSGTGNGRVYHIAFQATDSAGAKCTGTVLVCVPHDANGTCIDGGALYDSTKK